MKATKPKIIALFAGIVVLGTACLYLANYLTNLPAKPSASDLLSAGMDLFQKKLYKDARAKLEECRQKAPVGEVKNRALLFISRCYTAENNPEKAIETWKKVVENPDMRGDHAEAFYSLGMVTSAGGTEEHGRAAQEYYRKAAAASAGTRFAELAEIEIAKSEMDKGNLRGAKETLDKLREKGREYGQLREATFKLNMRLLFSPIITEVPESEYYAVKDGDTLDGIARKVGTTAELLQESNGVDPLRLQIGKRLKVVTGEFQLKVSKSRNVLQLLCGDVVLNEYPVGTGKFSSTPVGKFKIAKKTREPDWFPGDGRKIPYGDPENILGTRWMALESIDGQNDLTGYGIHGTDDETTIGRESSRGCIRLLNREVEELFKVVPSGTEVTIEE